MILSIKRICVLLMGVTASFLVASPNSEFPLDVVFSSPPIFYGGSFFGYADDALFKVNAYGNTEWQIEDLGNAKPQLESRFDTLFLLDRLGDLASYNSVHGYKIYALRGRDIRFFHLSYPFVFYQTESLSIGAADFLSGKVMWEKKKRPIQDIKRLGHSEKIVGLSSSYFYLFDVTDGKELFKAKLPHQDMRIAATSNDGAVLANPSAMVFFDREKQTFQALSFTPDHLLGWAFEKKAVFFDGNTLKVVDPRVDQVEWETSFSGQTRRSFMHQHGVILLMEEASELVVVVVDILSKDTRKIPLKLDEDTMQSIQAAMIHDGKVLFLTSSAIISI